MPSRPVLAAAALSLIASASSATPLEESTRPLPRPVAAQAYAPDAIVRPVLRPEAPEVPVATAEQTARFKAWVTAFRPRALNAGISGAVFDRAFRNAAFDPEVIARDRNQSEFTKTIWDYLASAASDKRIANGIEALDRHRPVLEQIEARYGVDKEVVVAIWGLESAYGDYRGTQPIIGSLATLADEGRRAAFFESQLIAALKILQNGDTTPDRMTGSWAGAMGHTQFIPTSYLDLAVDFNGDGRRDIWADDPTDALASTAAYLARFGWKKGMPWGVEVTLPQGFDYAAAKRSNTRLPSAWAKLGVVGVDGAPVPDHGDAAVLLPAGAQGAAFLVFSNFRVIERYNAADAYVIGVGHLSDRIRGKGPIQTPWPVDERALTLDERKEMQRLLTQRGFDTKGVDGKIGPLTIAAVRGFQRAANLAPDGYASLSVLKALR